MGGGRGGRHEQPHSCAPSTNTDTDTDTNTDTNADTDTDTDPNTNTHTNDNKTMHTTIAITAHVNETRDIGRAFARSGQRLVACEDDRARARQ